MVKRALSTRPDAAWTCARAIGAVLRGDDSDEADAGAMVLAVFIRSFLVDRKG
jgi:hypothetical protein